MGYLLCLCCNYHTSVNVSIARSASFKQDCHSDLRDGTVSHCLCCKSCRNIAWIITPCAKCFWGDSFASLTFPPFTSNLEKSDHLAFFDPWEYSLKVLTFFLWNLALTFKMSWDWESTLYCIDSVRLSYCSSSCSAASEIMLQKLCSGGFSPQGDITEFMVGKKGWEKISSFIWIII